jgi:uncharacterized RDD family membrane protein YckC
MTQTPPGWYADPDQAGIPGRLRYWDGAQWTAHIHDAAPMAPTYQYEYGPGPATTPDGQPLASWWQRVLAYLLDGLISFPLLMIAAVPVVSSQWGAVHRWFDDIQVTSANGTSAPATPDLFRVTTLPGFTLVLSLFAAQVLYQLVFLFWKRATPGKLIVGLRVRLRDSPDLPASAIFARVGSVLLLGLCWIIGLLDYLWPLWDQQNQALHDKIAGTNVVRVR